MRIFCFITLLLIPFYSFGQKIDLYDQLVLDFHFDGNTKDSGPSGLNGIIYGDVTYTTDRFNNPNSACYFDGYMDYIIVPESNTLDFGMADFSISLWFKTRDEATHMILMKGIDDPPDYAQYWIRLNDTWNNEALVFLVGDNIAPGSRVDYMYSETIADDMWHHIVAERNGELMKLYVDGKLKSEAKNVIENADNDIDMLIGAQYPRAEYGYHNFFKGSLDDIRIYARALNDCEVEALYSWIFPPER